MEHVVAVGLVPHTGWAWLVRVRAPAATAGTTCGEAVVELRARVVACDVLEGELFHRAADWTGDRERFVAEGRALALRQAGEALAAYVRGARRAVIVGKRVPLPPLEKTLAAHPRIHGAEGELWRAVFAEACAAHGLEPSRRDPGELRRALGTGHPAGAIARFLAAGRGRVGSPWDREVQDAALGAWSALEPTGRG